MFCFKPRRVPVAELLKEEAIVPASSADGATPLQPAAPCPVCPLLAENAEAARQATYGRVMHGRAVEREDKLKQRVAELEAKVRRREQQLFGRKTETSSAATIPQASAQTPTPSAVARPRGQQRGQPGHGRRDYSHLPATVENRERGGDACCCPQCHLPFEAIGGSEDATILEIEVRAHRRVVRRRRYRPTCACGVAPGVAPAPPPPRVIPKSMLGVSIWVAVLLDK